MHPTESDKGYKINISLNVFSISMAQKEKSLPTKSQLLQEKFCQRNNFAEHYNRNAEKFLVFFRYIYAFYLRSNRMCCLNICTCKILVVKYFSLNGKNCVDVDNCCHHKFCSLCLTPTDIFYEFSDVFSDIFCTNFHLCPIEEGKEILYQFLKLYKQTQLLICSFQGRQKFKFKNCRYRFSFYTIDNICLFKQFDCCFIFTASF